MHPHLQHQQQQQCDRLWAYKDQVREGNGSQDTPAVVAADVRTNITTAVSPHRLAYKDQVREAARGRRNPDDEVVDRHQSSNNGNLTRDIVVTEKSSVVLPSSRQPHSHQQPQLQSDLLPVYKDQVREGSSGGYGSRSGRGATVVAAEVGTDALSPHPLSYKDQAREAPRWPRNSEAAINERNQSPTPNQQQQRQIPTFKDHVHAQQQGPQISHEREPRETSNNNNNVDHAVVAVADAESPGPAGHNNDPPPCTGFGEGTVNIVIAEATGYLVEDIFEHEDENPRPEIADDRGRQQLKYPPTFFRRRKYVLVLVAGIVLVIAATTVGGICRSGACGGGLPPQISPGPTIAASATPSSSTMAQTLFVPYPRPFTSTKQLYKAVDECVATVYHGMATANRVNVTIKYGPIADWDVSRLTNFSIVFYGCDRSQMNNNITDLLSFQPPTTPFHKDVSSWNVASATTMEGMFAGATSFNQNLSAWNTSRVTTMRAMFHSAMSFDGQLGGWNVTAVTDLSGVFFDCTAFTGTEVAA